MPLTASSIKTSSSFSSSSFLDKVLVMESTMISWIKAPSSCLSEASCITASRILTLIVIPSGQAQIYCFGTRYRFERNLNELSAIVEHHAVLIDFLQSSHHRSFIFCVAILDGDFLSDSAHPMALELERAFETGR